MAAAVVAFALALLPAEALAQPRWEPKVTWNTYLGGAETDTAEGITTNELGDVFVTGSTNSIGFLGGTGLPSVATNRDAYVARIRANGEGVAWVRVFGSTDTNADSGMRVARGPGNTLYVVGKIRDLLNSGSGAQLTYSSYATGGSDAFLAQLSEDTGTLNWFMFLGGSGPDEAFDLAVDSVNNRVYVAGKTASDDFPVQTGRWLGRPDVEDAFVTRVDVSAENVPTIVWSRLIGSSEIDEGFAVALDGNALYLGGIIGSNDIKLTVDKFRSTFHSGTDDGFVTKLRADTGDVEWLYYVGGSGKDDVREILVRGDTSQLIVAGNTDSSNFAAGDTSGDVYLFRLEGVGSPSGMVQAVGVKGSLDETSGQAAMDAKGNVFIGGTTSSSKDLATPYGWDTEYSGSAEGFVAMWDPDVKTLLWSSYLGGANSVSGGAESVQGVAASPYGTLTLSGSSFATDLMRVTSGFDRDASLKQNGFLFRVAPDSTGPRPGTVTLERNSQGYMTASWSGFADEETDVVGYEWVITPKGSSDPELVFQSADVVTTTGTASEVAQPGTTYYAHVRAINAVGIRSFIISSPAFTVPVEGGTDGGTGPGPGEGTGEGELLSPIGWGCGSTGGGAMAGALAWVAGMLLLQRRMRRSDGR